MLVVFIIIGVIAAVSLYDYFTSRNWQMVTSDTRNNAVFENRNKEYGAYKIRKDYDRRLILILLSFTLGLGGVFGATSFFKPIEKPLAVVDDTRIIPTFETTFEDEVEPVIEEIVEEEVVATPEEQLKFKEIIVTDTEIPNPDITIVDPDKKIGLYDIKDEGKDFNIPPKEEKKTGIIEKKGGDNGDDIPPFVDEPAKYIGGIPALHEFIKSNINMNRVEGSGKIYVRFVVDEEGKVSRVSAVGKLPDCDGCVDAAIKVMQKSPNWIPAKNNGRIVKSYFTMPISIATE